jgi:glutathione S-transferase
MVVGPQAFGEKQYQQDDIRVCLDEFYNQILIMLDKKLQKYEYLCGEEYTVADLQIYYEIYTVLALHRSKRIESRELPNVFAWYNKLSSLPEIAECDKKFQEIVTKYNFA